MRRKLLGISTAISLVLAAGLIVTTGCEGKPSCKLLYKRSKKCEVGGKLGGKVGKAFFIELCKAARDKSETLKEQIKCSKHSDCKKFKKCYKQARKKGAAARHKKAWKEAVEKDKKKGNFSRRDMFCMIYKKDLSGELKKKCKALPQQRWDWLVKSASTKLAAGKVGWKEGVSCYTLKSAGKKVGKEAEAKALCKDFDIARSLKSGIKSANEYLAKGKKYLPYQCELKRFDKKYKESKAAPVVAMRQKLVNACFNKLGLAILKKRVPKMSYCPSDVKTIIKAVGTFKLANAELKGLVDQAKPKCKM